MIARQRLLSLVVLAFAATMSICAPARAEEKFANLALVDPVQVFDRDVTIRGVRLNLIYGVNRAMYGLDLGLVNDVRGETKGLQYGLVNLVDGPFTGWQNGLVNMTDGKFTGLGTAAYNGYRDAEGLVWGLVNVTDHMSGLQLGFVNYTRTLHGLQIGLLNIVKDKDKLPVLPIVNWSF